MKKFKGILIAILCVIILLTAGMIYRQVGIKNKTKSLTNNIKEQVNNLSDITSIKYNYTDIAEYKDKIQFNGISLPFTNKGYLVKYSGYLKAGIDMEDMEIRVINPNKVEIKLPEAKILDNVIEEENVYFYNEKDSAFNRLKFDDLYDLLIEEKKKKEKELVDKGILNNANKNVMNTINLIIGSIGEIEVVFK